MTNNKNNDEIKSTHPEAFEDIKVSDSVPNSYKELLELQKPKIESIDDLVSEGKIDPEKAKFLKLCTETFQSVLDLLNKLKSSPGQDIFIATMLIQRVYLFNKTYLEKAQKNKELSENEFNNLSESNAKLKCIFHMLVPDDEELDENGLNFTN